MKYNTSTSEFCPLTRESVAALLIGRHMDGLASPGTHRRKSARWPFQGTVEVWIPNKDGTERYLLASSLNLSIRGVGIRTEEPLRVRTQLAIAIHEPEVTFHGRAAVRHCTQIEDGFYIGLQFCFDK